MKALVVLVLLAGLGAGVYFAFLQPTDLPELVLQDAEGNRVTSSQLRGDGEALLVTFLLPRCPLSKFTAELMTEQLENTSEAVVFAGLVFGNKDQAAELQQDWGLPFGCYGLRGAPDPLAVNELIDAVGFSHGSRKAVTGGTILLIDAENKLLFKLEKDEVRDLATKLADAGY